LSIPPQSCGASTLTSYPILMYGYAWEPTTFATH
jgi:hypothetical protein